MQTMTRNQVTTGVYTLTYQMKAGKPIKVLLQPTLENLRNGVIMEETEENSGVMRGRMLTGKNILMRMDCILNVSPLGA